MSRYLRDRQTPYRGPNYALRRWVLLLLMLLAAVGYGIRACSTSQTSPYGYVHTHWSQP